MRYQGKITDWKDDQGFGFVTPNGRDEKAFVHIKAFSSRSRRPANGDIITYELTFDAKRRSRADNVRFVGDRATPIQSSGTSSLATVFVVLFFIFLVSTSLAGWLPLSVLGVYIGASVIAFIVYAIDKSAAQKNRWRIQESKLHFLGLIGGWPGAFFAQRTLRHKSKKEEFQTVFWTTVFLNCCALGWLLTKSGSTFLQSVIGLGT